VRIVRGIGRFVVDFVVGDDWRVALGVAVAIGAAAGLVDGNVSAWWFLPLAVLAILWLSLSRETRRASGRA
jgi:hypothetical protein